jgi:hypothetical protein
MNKSESIANLAKALSIAQGQMGGAVKGKANPFFKSVYADLSSVVEAIREPLSSNGLSYVQVTHPSERNEVIVETVLMHESGEWLSGTLAMPVSKADAQGFGSAITYAKRYGLQGLLGVPSDDDDGNAASQKKAEPEGKGKEKPPAIIDQAKLKNLQDLTHKAKADMTVFLDLFGIKSLAEMPVLAYQKAVEKLEKKIASMPKADQEYSVEKAFESMPDDVPY